MFLFIKKLSLGLGSLCLLLKAVDREGLHEGQGEEQDAAEVIRNLRLAGDAVDAAAGGDALTDAGADRREADGEAGADSGERRDPDAIVGVRHLRGRERRRGHDGSRDLRRGLRRLRGRHEGAARKDDGDERRTREDQRANHL